MKTKMNRLLSAVLACVMALTLLPAFAAFAEETPEIVASGYCGGEGDGTNLTWTLDSEGLLTVSGEGKMKNYTFHSNRCAPWTDRRTEIRQVVIGNGVTSIGNSAFLNCSALTHVTISDTVTYLGSEAFCKSALTSVTIPDSVTVLANEAFEHCESLESAVIGNGVSRLGHSIFLSCHNLTNVVIGKKVPELTYDMFALTGLSSVTIPASVSSINGAAFRGVPLESIAVDPVNSFFMTGADGVLYNWNQTKLVLYPCNKEAASFAVPDGVTTICDDAFQGCGNLQEVTFPDSLTKIGECAFKSCWNITGITLPDSVTEIGIAAFSYCSALAQINIPPHIGVIRNQTFRNCALTDVTVPAGIKAIEGSAFNSCGSLAHITLPDSLMHIGAFAFDGCTALTQVHIPDSVTSIDNSAFFGCRSLTEITLPARLTKLDYQTFAECAGLKSVTVPAALKEIEFSAFKDCSALSDVYYALSEEHWNQIMISDDNNGNDALHNAAMHYNCHDHIPGAAVIENSVPATCTEGGGCDEVVYCTLCDYEFSRTHVTVNANGHTPGETVIENSVPATCTGNGGYDEVVYCVNCPAECSRTHIGIPAAGHSWGEWKIVKQATAQEEGLMRRTCLRDPSHAEEEVIPKLDRETNAFLQFIERIRSFFSNIADWFSRLFSF